MIALLFGCTNKNEGGQPIGTDNTARKPANDINVIVAYKAGSSYRYRCQYIAEKYVGRSLVVINKEGADGKIEYIALANAKPDGHTMWFINLSAFNSLAAESNNLFTVNSIVPIINHLFELSVGVVRKYVPWNIIEDLINYCKEHSNEVKCSTSGVKASNHIGAQLLAKSAGFQLGCIPYVSIADKLLALRQGEVDISVPKAGYVASLIGANGELKVKSINYNFMIPEELGQFIAD